jgi:hypothetical protein
MKDRFKLIAFIVGDLVWRGFGILLFIIGGAAGSGALITGDPFTGILIAWSTLMLGIIGDVGYAIAVTGKVSRGDVARATKDAVQKFQEDTQKK